MADLCRQIRQWNSWLKIKTHNDVYVSLVRLQECVRSRKRQVVCRWYDFCFHIAEISCQLLAPINMTRADLIRQLADKFPPLTARDIELSVRTILDGVTHALAKGERIEIRGFGSFHLNYRPQRKGRNPKSGTTVMIPAKYAPHFRAGKELRKRVDIYRSIGETK